MWMRKNLLFLQIIKVKNVAKFNKMNILEFYSNKTIFITGTTGFVGKVVLEKILRSLPDLKRIYIMVRAKKGFTPM